MKKIAFIIAFMPMCAYSVAPSTSCPTGYVTVTRSNFIMATACPTGYVAARKLNSCLNNATYDCWLYAPAGMSFTDESGTYEYTDVCPMS